MRLWSLHPCQLDSKGLVALWREGLLALAVVQGKTRGYRHHPQLARFARQRHPVHVLTTYLRVVQAEAGARGYAFDATKLGRLRSRVQLAVTRGQLDHEWGHLLRKLHRRARARWVRQRASLPQVHPMFRIVPGRVEDWERSH
jgi:hypothetical protein